MLKYFENDKTIKDNFDIIFIDPPYKEKKINFLLEKIRKKKILDKNGLVILHRHKKDNVKINEEFQIIDQRTYGISKIIIGN